MSVRRFTIFHLSFITVDEPIFETPKIDRESWLRSVLKDLFAFPHRGDDDLHWVPREDIDECIFGVIQQERDHTHHLSPEDGGSEVISPEWQGAYVLIDPTHHEDGQKIAVENDVVGKPSALIKSLLTAINARPERPFNIEAEMVFDGGDFWNFSEEHQNILTKIEFEFVVPNMWGASSALEKDLEETRDQTGAERVKVAIESKDGLKSNTQITLDGVAYAEKGGGRMKARAANGDTYSSEDTPKTTEIPKTETTASQIRLAISEFKNRVLGRG